MESIIENFDADNLLANNDTIVLADGISYPINGGTIIRQSIILSNACVVFSPIDVDRLNEINKHVNTRPTKYLDKTTKEENEYDTYQLKSFHLNSITNEIQYTREFRKSTCRLSVNHYNDGTVKFNIDALSLIEKALKMGFTILRLENNTTSKKIYNCDLTKKKIMFIVGNENMGIGKAVLSLKNDNIIDVIIPTTLEKNSLNVGTAVSIACYERFRQLDSFINK